MALLEQWQKVAYNEKADRGELQRFWQRYFLLEKGVYEQLLTNPDEKVEGTVKELAEKDTRVKYLSFPEILERSCFICRVRTCKR